MYEENIMIRQENLENNRKNYLFEKKKVSVVKSHNFVLPVWAEYCAITKKEYRLITFDYHMDTRPIFHSMLIENAMEIWQG